MKEVWDGEAIKKLYQEDPHLQGEWIDFTVWAKAVYVNDSDDIYIPLHVKVRDKRMHREIVLGILYAILVKRYKWSSIKSYYYLCVSAWIAFCEAQPKSLYLETISQEVVDAFVQESPNPTQAKKRQAFITKMHAYLAIFLTDRPIMDRDIWSLEYFRLSAHRKCGSDRNCSIRFDDIPNNRNRRLLKLYIKYLLEQTDSALCTVMGTLYPLKRFFRWWGNRPIDNFLQKDLEEYALTFDEKHNVNRNAAMCFLRNFFAKGIEFGLCLVKPLWYDDMTKYQYPMRRRAVSNLVIGELFARLDKLPRTVAALILVIYYSGIRISEAVHLRVDAVRSFPTEETKYIQVYQYKMRKYVITPIPNHLYELLLQQRDDVLRQNPQEQLLFPQKPGVSFNTSYLSQYMRRFCKKEKIYDENGEFYHFRVHEFRHSYAMRLIRNDVPFLTVQHLLHHDSPEMTLNYARLDEETGKRRYLQFCEKNEDMRRTLSPEERDVDDDMIWLHHQISQVLPHGYCGYPIKLGACPYANACLFCDKFSTTTEFLPVLRYQLAKNRQLQRCQQEVNKEELKRVEKRLLEIIQAVKGGTDDNISTTSSQYG